AGRTSIVPSARSSSSRSSDCSPIPSARSFCAAQAVSASRISCGRCARESVSLAELLSALRRAPLVQLALVRDPARPARRTRARSPERPALGCIHRGDESDQRVGMEQRRMTDFPPEWLLRYWLRAALYRSPAPE